METSDSIYRGAEFQGGWLVLTVDESNMRWVNEKASGIGDCDLWDNGTKVQASRRVSSGRESRCFFEAVITPMHV